MAEWFEKLEPAHSFYGISSVGPQKICDVILYKGSSQKFDYPFYSKYNCFHIVGGVTRWLPHVERELLNLPRRTWVHVRFWMGFVLLDFYVSV